MTKEIHSAFEILKKGGIIVYPTDTVWGIGCDATNAEAVQRIYDLKERSESKSMICLVNDIKMLEHHIEQVPEAALDILKLVEKPTTIIYDKPYGIAENLISDDQTLAIRIVQDEFCQELIKKLKAPLVSTSANKSGFPTPNSFKEIHVDILKGVDYVVNLHRDKTSPNPSSILKLSNDGLVKIIRA